MTGLGKKACKKGCVTDTTAVRMAPRCIRRIFMTFSHKCSVLTSAKCTADGNRHGPERSAVRMRAKLPRNSNCRTACNCSRSCPSCCSFCFTSCSVSVPTSGAPSSPFTWTRSRGTRTSARRRSTTFLTTSNPTSGASTRGTTASCRRWSNRCMQAIKGTSIDVASLSSERRFRCSRGQDSTPAARNRKCWTRLHGTPPLRAMTCRT
mmetsp:Transcript_66850/g.118630  ORF Transcript_66850/g.118630 Transcript_66850/m.118630 type:complete len:207 (+) Transcript_66850:280-900(+)